MRIWGAAAAVAIIIACLSLTGCVTRVTCPAPPTCPSCPSGWMVPGRDTIVPNVIQTPCTPETCGGVHFIPN